MSFTLQTTELGAPLTVAANVCERPMRTDAYGGLTATVMPF